jgi:TolB-like protein/DNA-binding winged helix-turn-helix (wHTH) protein/Flp pilus assembly protein TadD
VGQHDALDSNSYFLGKTAMPETISPEPATLIVGEFTLNLTTGELECDGVRTRLQDKPFQVLRMLAEQAGELVTREQLCERLWPQGTYVEFEMGLNTAVRKLRTALRDDADAPRYIETFPRRGYRLLAAVKSSTTGASEPSVSQSPVGAPPVESPYAGREPEVGPGDSEPAAATLITAVHASGKVRPRGRRWWVPASAAVLVLTLAYLVANRFWLSQSTEQSIVVLPFVDMSERKDQEYFSDGLSEELIELLGRTPALRVIARTSSFHFKGRAEKLETIAAELRVANVLEGSVRKSGDRLRVTAQLIRAATSEHLWSETFDRDPQDIFKVQDEIAGAVVAALRVHLLPLQQSAPTQGLHTANLEAYNLYLQGRQSYNQGDAAGFQRAVTAFRAATTLDPQYAAAYADLALAQFWLADNTTDVAGYESALAAAERAVALAPGLAAGYSARGFLRAVYQFDFVGGQADLDRAVALSPQDAMVLHRSAVLLGVLGNLPAAIATERKALALDPLSEEICRRLGFFFVADQQFARARPLYEKALAIAPNSDRARYNLGDLELLENRPEQALASFRQTRITELNLTGQAKAEYSLRHMDVSQRLLEQLIARSGKTSPAFIARVYAWRGEKKEALEWAERAYVQRESGITWLKIDPDFRSVRADPRYQALLSRMKLPN